jgi:hypothetical protein
MNPLTLARIVGHRSLRMIEQADSPKTSDTYEAKLQMLTDNGAGRIGC